MDLNLVCRLCLKKEHLNPVFHDSKDWSRYSTAVFITTGIKIYPWDGLPQTICSLCVHFINQSLSFRTTSKEVETKLLNAKVKLKDGLDISKENMFLETLKVFSGNSVNDNKIKLDADDNIQETDSTDSCNIKTEYYTNFEILEDDEDDDEIPLSFICKTTALDGVTDNTKEIKVEHTKSEDSLLCIQSNQDVQSRNNRVTCKLCQKNLSIRSFDTHMNKVHPGADERKIKCDLCDSYLMKEKMNRHMSIVHGIKKGQEKNSGRCKYCKIEFESKEVLIDHVTNCMAKKKRQKPCESGRQLTECDICNKTMQKSSLRLHKAMAHGGMKPVCEHCGRTFGNKFRLNEHYRAKHGYDKFRCSYCDFQSSGIVAMRNHERRHRGEKPFVCETCGAKFHAAYLLAQHKQSHRTERPAKCDLCSASFKTTNSLHGHKKACHGPPLFKCTECSRSFSCKHYFVKHMRRAHRHSGPLPPPLVAPNLQDGYDAES